VKHVRALERAPITTDDRFYTQVTNPTTEQLSKYAQMLLNNATQDKPIQFFGEVPYFVTPTSIVLAEQFGVEPRQWVMMKQDATESLSPL